MISCKQCSFWMPQSEFTGECRRHPPVIINALVAFELKQNTAAAIYFCTRWPITVDTSSCGEGRGR
jgi:hypothetical protein